MSKLIVIMLIMLITTLFSCPTYTKAATENTLRNKLKENTSETIREFVYADMNGDGKKEAIAITAKSEGDFGYTDAKVWYVTSTACKKIVACEGWELYPDSFKVYNQYNRKDLQKYGFVSSINNHFQDFQFQHNLNVVHISFQFVSRTYNVLHELLQDFHIQNVGIHLHKHHKVRN